VGLFKFFALYLEIRYAIVLFLLEIVRDLTVFAIDPCLCTNLEMIRQVAIGNHAAALTSYFAVWA